MEAEVTRQVNDVIMKAVAGTFKDKTLKIFGLDTPRIKAVIPTVLPVLEVKENRTDYIFLLHEGLRWRRGIPETARKNQQK